MIIAGFIKVAAAVGGFLVSMVLFFRLLEIFTSGKKMTEHERPSPSVLDLIDTATYLISSTGGGLGKGEIAPSVLLGTAFHGNRW
jgi:hypothetical protein